jgi:hypothetical protein
MVFSFQLFFNGTYNTELARLLPGNQNGFFNKNSLLGKFNIEKTELYVKKEKPQDMKEGFRPVL